MDHEEELKLLKISFPNVTCFCELCDCGRHRHHKDCPRARKQKSPTKYQPLTDYQATFKAYKDPKPRSSKRPCPPKRVVPPPLDGKTVQRETFKAIDVEKHGRPPAYHKTDEYGGPSVPFDHKSTHQAVYIPKPIDTVEHVPPKPPTFSINQTGVFHSNTTNSDFFRDWRHPEVAVSFTEPPSFMDSMLFPGQKLGESKSVMRASYPGKVAKKVQPAKIPDGNLHVGEGAYDHLTVNRDVYRGAPGQKSKIVIHTPELNRNRKSSFYGETQNDRDFIKYAPNAGRRQPAEPAPDTINLKFNNRRVFDTEQRVIYKGHDTRVHCAPEPARKEYKDYQKPAVPFETKTSNKVDYIPRDLAAASQERAKMPESQWDTTGGKFHSETAYNHYYQSWDTPRGPQRYGDFLDGINSMYLPPTKPFNATTTNMDQYKPKTTELRENMKPKPVPVAKLGSHDFDTVHRLTYRGEKPPLCRAEAFVLQQQLKQRLAEEGIEGSVLAQSMQPSTKKTVCIK